MSIEEMLREGQTLDAQQRGALMAAAKEYAQNFILDAAFTTRLLKLKKITNEVDKLFVEVTRQRNKRNPAFKESDLDLLSDLLLTDDIKDMVAFVRGLEREAKRTEKAVNKMRERLNKKGFR